MNNCARYISIFAILWLGLISCADQQNVQKLRGGPQIGSELQLLSSNRLIVVDKNDQPITNATILVGFGAGDPFAGNELTTDAAGVAEVPADWKAPLPITVRAPGYIAQTVPVVEPGDLRVRLSVPEGANEFAVAGTPQGYGRIVTDGKVDFALMIPALSRENLLAFDISTVISPQTDNLTIVGKNIPLPSNIAVPRQTENYFIPVTLNKPGYRVIVRDPGQYKLSAIHGQFPLQKVKADLDAGKSIFELVNHFSFLQGGQQTVDVSGNVSNVDMAVNQTRFTGNINVTAPSFPAGQVMVSLAASESEGLLMPTDLKRFTPGQSLALKSDPAATNNVISILLEDAAGAIKTVQQWFAPLYQAGTVVPDAVPRTTTAVQDFKKLSLTLNPSAAGVAPQFLPLIGKPVVNGNLISLEVPALPAGLNALATYLVFSEVEAIGSGATATERRTRLWEVWAKSWVSEVELPQITFTRRPDRKYRWEVIFMAGPGTIVVDPNGGAAVDLNTVSHVTRNATDI